MGKHSRSKSIADMSSIERLGRLPDEKQFSAWTKLLERVAEREAKTSSSPHQAQADDILRDIIERRGGVGRVENERKKQSEGDTDGGLDLDDYPSGLDHLSASSQQDLAAIQGEDAAGSSTEYSSQSRTAPAAYLRSQRQKLVQELEGPQHRKPKSLRRLAVLKATNTAISPTSVENHQKLHQVQHATEMPSVAQEPNDRSPAAQNLHSTVSAVSDQGSAQTTQQQSTPAQQTVAAGNVHAAAPTPAQVR